MILLNITFELFTESIKMLNNVFIEWKETQIFSIIITDLQIKKLGTISNVQPSGRVELPTPGLQDQCSNH